MSESVHLSATRDRKLRCYLRVRGGCRMLTDLKRASGDMPGRTSATLWLTESAQLPAPRRASKTSDPASFPDMLAEKSDTRADTGDQRLLPNSGLTAAAPSTSTPLTRAGAQRLPVGILLYLISVWLVAVTTIAVFFGTGFFLLAHHAEETTAGSDSSDYGTEIKSPSFGFSSTPMMMPGKALVETELPRSVTAAALPIVPFAQGPAAYQALPLENSEAALSYVPGPPIREAPVSAASVASPTEKVPVSRSAAPTATVTPPAQAVPARRSKGRSATPIPPSKTIAAQRSRMRTGTLTPPSQTVPARRSTTGREATPTPPLQTRERPGRP